MQVVILSFPDVMLSETKHLKKILRGVYPERSRRAQNDKRQKHDKRQRLINCKLVNCKLSEGLCAGREQLFYSGYLLRYLHLPASRWVP